MIRRTKLRRLAAIMAGPLLAAALIAGCGGDEQSTEPSGGDERPAASGAADERQASQVATISGVQHVHGLGVNPAGGEIMIATHQGLWQVAPGAAEAEPAGDSRDDFMGFTVVGPDSFLSSGHPGPGSNLPPLLGLQRSLDGGATWQTVSLLGEADLHVLKASGNRIYGVDSGTGTFLTSSDEGQTWDAFRTPGQVIDIAIDPRDPRRLVASTDRGLYGSGNAGEGWTRLNGDGIGLLTWPGGGELLMVDGSGRVMISGDGGRTFDRAGSIGSAPEVFASGEGRVLASIDGGKILVSDDDGRRWATAVEPEG